MEWFRKTASNWSTGKPTVVKTRNVSTGASETKAAGSRLLFFYSDRIIQIACSEADNQTGGVIPESAVRSLGVARH